MVAKRVKKKTRADMGVEPVEAETAALFVSDRDISKGLEKLPPEERKIGEERLLEAKVKSIKKPEEWPSEVEKGTSNFILKFQSKESLEGLPVCISLGGRNKNKLTFIPNCQPRVIMTKEELEYERMLERKVKEERRKREGKHGS